MLYVPILRKLEDKYRHSNYKEENVKIYNKEYNQEIREDGRKYECAVFKFSYLRVNRYYLKLIHQ